ncbi:MAG: SMC-Scp complex subunit ScpB [Bryobacteraceae bacterium]
MEEKLREAAPQQPEPNETVRPDHEPALSAGHGSSAGSAEPGAVEAGELTADELLGTDRQPVLPADAERAQLKAVVEAIVYVLNEPTPASQIAQALGRPVEDVEALLRELAEETGRPDRGIFIREVAGGYQMATKPEHHEIIRNFVRNLKQPLKLSQAALETLAVIAYKQPITLPEILEIRGVQGAGVIKTLIDRKLVTTAGRKNVIGRPILYKTTREFLTQFGLKDLSELPSLKEFEEIRRQSLADEEFEPAASEPAPAAEGAAPEAASAAVSEGQRGPQPAAPAGSQGEDPAVAQATCAAAQPQPPDSQDSTEEPPQTAEDSNG